MDFEAASHNRVIGYKISFTKRVLILIQLFTFVAKSVALRERAILKVNRERSIKSAVNNAGFLALHTIRDT